MSTENQLMSLAGLIALIFVAILVLSGCDEAEYQRQLEELIRPPTPEEIEIVRQNPGCTLLPDGNGLFCPDPE